MTLVVSVLYAFSGDPSDPSQLTVAQGEKLLYVNNFGDGWTELSLFDGSATGIVPTDYVSAPFEDFEPSYDEPPAQQNGYDLYQSSSGAQGYEHNSMTYGNEPYNNGYGGAQGYTDPSQTSGYGQYQASNSYEMADNQQYYDQNQYYMNDQQGYEQTPPSNYDNTQQSNTRPELTKYASMRKAGLPEGAVVQAAQIDGVILPPDFFQGSQQQQQELPARAAPGLGNPQFSKYEGMQKAGLPEGAIRQAAQIDGVQLPESFFGGGSQSQAPSHSYASPPPAQMDSSSDPQFAKYANMKKVGLAEGAIRQAAERDNVSLPPSFFQDDVASSQPQSFSSPPMNVSPQYEKYARMQKAGLAEGAIRQAAERDGVQLPQSFFQQDSTASAMPVRAAPQLSPVAGTPPQSDGQNNALLASIQGFNKGALKQKPKQKPVSGNRGGSGASPPQKSQASPANDMMAAIAAKAKARQARQDVQEANSMPSRKAPGAAASSTTTTQGGFPTRAASGSTSSQGGVPARAAPGLGPTPSPPPTQAGASQLPGRKAPAMSAEAAGMPTRSAPAMSVDPVAQAKLQRANSSRMSQETPSRAAPAMSIDPAAQAAMMQQGTPSRAAPSMSIDPAAQAALMQQGAPSRAAPAMSIDPMAQAALMQQGAPSRAAPAMSIDPVAQANFQRAYSGRMDPGASSRAAPAMSIDPVAQAAMMQQRSGSGRGYSMSVDSTTQAAPSRGAPAMSIDPAAQAQITSMGLTRQAPTLAPQPVRQAPSMSIDPAAQHAAMRAGHYHTPHGPAPALPPGARGNPTRAPPSRAAPVGARQAAPEMARQESARAKPTRAPPQSKRPPAPSVPGAPRRAPPTRGASQREPQPQAPVKKSSWTLDFDD